MKKLLLVLLVTAHAALAQSKVELAPEDSIRSVLSRLTGQKVELRLKSGDKLAGKIEKMTDKVIHLSGLTGQEFYDAVVLTEEVSAVVVRTK